MFKIYICVYFIIFITRAGRTMRTRLSVINWTANYKEIYSKNRYKLYISAVRVVCNNIYKSFLFVLCERHLGTGTADNGNSRAFVTITTHDLTFEIVVGNNSVCDERYVIRTGLDDLVNRKTRRAFCVAISGNPSYNTICVNSAVCLVAIYVRCASPSFDDNPPVVRRARACTAAAVNNPTKCPRATVE